VTPRGVTYLEPPDVVHLTRDQGQPVNHMIAVVDEDAT